MGLLRSGLAVLAVLLALTGAAAVAGAQFISSAHPGGPYRGVVVDALTNRPIEGAVVLAVWNRQRRTVTRIHDEFYEAREVVTDADGRFVLDAADIEHAAPERTKVPLIYVYKPGYRPVEGWSDGYNPPKPLPTALISGRTFALAPVTAQQDRIRATDRLPAIGVPPTKMRLMMTAINRERVRFGFQPYPMSGGSDHE